MSTSLILQSTPTVRNTNLMTYSKLFLILTPRSWGSAQHISKVVTKRENKSTKFWAKPSLTPRRRRISSSGPISNEETRVPSTSWAPSSHFNSRKCLFKSMARWSESIWHSKISMSRKKRKRSNLFTRRRETSGSAHPRGLRCPKHSLNSNSNQPKIQICTCRWSLKTCS